MEKKKLSFNEILESSRKITIKDAQKMQQLEAILGAPPTEILFKDEATYIVQDGALAILSEETFKTFINHLENECRLKKLADAFKEVMEQQPTPTEGEKVA